MEDYDSEIIGDEEGGCGCFLIAVLFWAIISFLSQMNKNQQILPEQQPQKQVQSEREKK